MAGKDLFAPRSAPKPEEPERGPRRPVRAGWMQLRIAAEEREALRQWAERAGMTSADAVRLAIARLLRTAPEKGEKR